MLRTALVSFSFFLDHKLGACDSGTLAAEMGENEQSVTWTMGGKEAPGPPWRKLLVQMPGAAEGLLQPTPRVCGALLASAERFLRDGGEIINN